MRLDKFVSHAALLSRRDACRAIAAGRVTVCGKQVRDTAAVTADDADVTLDGKRLFYSRFIYIILNKPAGYITATEDARPGELVVAYLLPDNLRSRGLFPVGRLDRDTTGVLIFTNDGDTAHRALSPKHHVAKSYRFTYSGNPLDADALSALCGGVDIGERDGAGRTVLTAPAKIEDDVITITEGKFHQIKRMFSAVGREIVTLQRISFAGITLGDKENQLASGQWRYLSEEETDMLRNA